MPRHDCEGLFYFFQNFFKPSKLILLFSKFAITLSTTSSTLPVLRTIVRNTGLGEKAILSVALLEVFPLVGDEARQALVEFIYTEVLRLLANLIWVVSSRVEI